MARIKHAVATRRRKKRVLKQAKGQFGHRSRRYKQAKISVVKGLTYAFRDRKVRKREFKRLWIIRINAACQESGIQYSRFIKGLNDAKVEINRKVLAELAVNQPNAFKKLVKIAQGEQQTAPKSKEVKAEAKTETKSSKKTETKTTKATKAKAATKETKTAKAQKSKSEK